MRRLNRIGLLNNNLAILGPGSTWKDVLEVLPPTKFTMIHGQCTSVGVAGYLLGGGINVVGTSERYGSGADHVVRYTMVDAKGRILLVSNLVKIYTHTLKKPQKSLLRRAAHRK